MNEIRRLKLYSEIEDSISIFDNLDYSIITGGFVQNPQKLSDVDVITVLPCVSKNIEEQIISFAKRHVNAQINNGFIPDPHFPSDILTRGQILDAINGRSFVIENNRIKLVDYSQEEYINNPESDYRIWVYEMISHDFDIIRGSFDILVNDTITALKTIWLYTVSLFDYTSEIPIEQVRHDLFLTAGLPYYLNEKQCRYFITMLKKYEMATITGDGILLLNDEIINEQIIKLQETINKGFSSTHFIKWDVLRKKVSRK